MLEKSIIKYHNKSMEVVELIEELIKLAKKMRKARDRGR